MAVMVVVLVHVEHPNGFECLLPCLPKLYYYVVGLDVNMPHILHIHVALKDVIDQPAQCRSGVKTTKKEKEKEKEKKNLLQHNIIIILLIQIANLNYSKRSHF